MADKLQFKQGDVILREGEFDTQMYIVQSGKVDIFVNYGKENEKKLTTVEAEGIFGEMGLLDYMPRTATAVAASDVDVDMLDQDDFAMYSRNNPKVMYKVLKSVTDRTAYLSKEYQDCCTEIAEYYKAEKAGKGTLSEKLKARIGFGKTRA